MLLRDLYGCDIVPRYVADLPSVEGLPPSGCLSGLVEDRQLVALAERQHVLVLGVRWRAEAEQGSDLKL